MKNKLLALAALLCVTLLAWAQESKPTATAPATASSTAAKPAATKPAPKKPGEGITAIVGGDVYTVTREIIRNGTVLMKEGKITAVGMDLPVPEGATVIDARGKFVAPGFVAISATNVGLRAALGGVAGNRTGGPPTSSRQAKLADSLNPYDRNIKFCLGVGITTANVEVNANPFGRFGRSFEDPDDEIRLCPCCNQPFLSFEPITPVIPTERGAIRSAILKMTYGELAPMLVKENPFYHLPASALAGSLNRTQWRETLKKAKAAAKQQSSGDLDDMGDGMGGGMGLPQRSTIPPEVIALAKKEIPLRTEASSVDSIRDMIALAKELDYRLVLDDVVEGWVVPKELAEAGVSVIYTPRTRRQQRPGREENTGSNIESSRIFEESGVAFSVSSLGSAVSLDGIAGRDLTSLPLEAMFAQRGGCSPQAALAALTIVPARQLGIANRVGSLEPGKDADILILDGPPLDYRTYVEKAFVQGTLYYDRAQDRIYPDR